MTRRPPAWNAAGHGGPQPALAARPGDRSDGDPDAYLRTDEVAADLGGRSVRSGVITVGGQAAQFVVGVGSTMVLARLLTPADFGLFAMVLSFTAFTDTFRDFGLPMAVVHAPEITHRQISDLFWLNLKLTGAVALLIGLLAPVLVWFYGEPRLLGLTLVVAAGTLVLGLALQHESIMKRRMRFGAFTTVKVASVLGGGLAGIAAAILGAGYWSLAVAFLARAVIRTGAAWTLCRWRPQPRGGVGMDERTALGKFLCYGRNHSGYRLVTHVGERVDRILVGYLAGAGPLGMYQHAAKWAMTPVMQLYLPLRPVIVSTLSRSRDAPGRYREHARRALLPFFAIGLPALAFLVVEARSVILVLLGPQWVPAVPLFRLLCVATAAQTAIWSMNLLYLSEGRTGRQARWGLISAPVLVTGVALGTRWGPVGIAAGYAVASTLLAPPGVVYCLAGSRVTVRDVLWTVARPAAAAAAGAAGCILLQPVSDGLPLLVRFVLSATVFLAAALVTWFGVPGGRAASAQLLNVARAAWVDRESGRVASGAKER